LENIFLLLGLVGTETIIDGIWDCKGHTRALLDPQRIYNINSSANVEFGALQTKSPITAPVEALKALRTFTLELISIIYLGCL
jgi:hypothetical protein